MSARTHPVSPAVGARLAELLMTAAAELSVEPRPDLAPMGIPVRGGRVALGRLRETLPLGERLEVITGFAVASWIGPAPVRSPDLGRLTYRGRTGVDRRGRVMLHHRARAWLAVGGWRHISCGDRLNAHHHVGGRCRAVRSRSAGADG